MGRKRQYQGNRIETGHKTFDQRANASIVSVGNVWSHVQASSYVRPVDEIECNGHTFPPGHLQSFDLGHFNPRVPEYVERATREAADRDGGAILYRFFYWRGPRRIDLGWVITDRQYRLQRTFPASTPKAYQVIYGVLPFITEDSLIEA